MREFIGNQFHMSIRGTEAVMGFERISFGAASAYRVSYALYISILFDLVIRADFL